MSKSEVISWRLSPELKAELEAAAQSQDSSVSSLIESVIRDWLESRPAMAEGDQREHDRVTRELDMCIGAVAGTGVSATNEVVRRVIKAKLKAKHARSAPPR